MKQYLLFGWNAYEAAGGWHDLNSDHDSLDAAKRAACKTGWEEFCIVDITTGEIVAEGQWTQRVIEKVTTHIGWREGK